MYNIVKQIGRGANGQVFLVKHKNDQTECVIKRLRMRDISAPERVTIETELKLLKDFRHPNIVAFKDSFIDNSDSLNIVMPYCEGGDMHNLIEEAGGKKFPEKQILDWIVQIGLAIHYMHERRILHRDVKTQNVFLTNGRALLGDLGVAKVLQETVDLARTNIGTPYYMSPQQYRQKPYSYKSDIWAFGCIIYEMCNHKHVFEALSINALAIKVMRGSYSPVSEVYSQNLRALVDEMLSQNPKKRPSILQILKKPFLIKKVQAYLRQLCNKSSELDVGQLESIRNQGKALGVVFEEENAKMVEETPRKRTKSQSKISSVEKAKKQKQKKDRNQKLEQIRQKLVQEEQARKKAKQQLSDYKKLRNKRSTSEKNLLQPKNVQNNKKGASSSRISTSPSSKQTHESHIKLKPKIEEIEKKQEIKKPEKKREEIEEKIQVEQVKKVEKVEKIEKVQKVQKVQKQEVKAFKIEEEYDMHYEQESEESQNQPIIEEEEEEEDQEGQKRAEEVIKLKEQVKQKTQIITSLRNELTKLDFQISSDSEGDQAPQKFNPAYTRITEKINELKEKVILQLGRDGYSRFIKDVMEIVASSNVFGKKMIEEKLGEGNGGLIFFAENIVKLERVMKKIPKYM